MTLNNIASIAFTCGDYDTALEYLKKSLAISREIGDKSGEGVTSWNLVEYRRRGDRLIAIEFARRTVLIEESLGLPDAEKSREYLLSLEKEQSEESKNIP